MLKFMLCIGSISFCEQNLLSKLKFVLNCSLVLFSDVYRQYLRVDKLSL